MTPAPLGRSTAPPDHRRPQLSSQVLQQFLEVEQAIVECENKFMADNFHVKSEQLEELDLLIQQLTLARNEVTTEA